MKLQRCIHLCAWLAFGAALLSACEDDAIPATAIVVSVQSDIEELASIRVAVFPADADPSSDTPEKEHIETVPATLSDLPVSIVVSQGNEDELMVAVRGLDSEGNFLAEMRTRVQFEPRQTLLLPIRLASICRDQHCDEEQRQTCYVERSRGTNGGECGPIPLQRASDLTQITDPVVEWDADFPSMDAGSEAGAEAGIDADTGTDREPSTEGGPEAGPGDSGPGSDARPPTSDASMCVPPALSNAQCGLSPSCGCPVGQTCRVTGAQETSCRPTGSVPANSACLLGGDCGPGHDCIGNRCTRYCQVDSDCGTGGICHPVSVDGKPVAGVNACLTACSGNSGCGPGLVCANFSNESFAGRTVNGNFCANEPNCTSSSSCGTGNSCLAGLCRKTCTSNADCGVGLTCNATLGRCVSTCDPSAATNSCRPGLLCSTVFDTCVRPQSPCPDRSDNICDEPEGSKWCVEGTDPVDCAPRSCATTPYQGTCDLVSQCGCERNQQCVINTINPSGALAVTCEAMPSTTPVDEGAVCSDTASCAKGFTCVRETSTGTRRCRRNCRSDAECTAFGSTGLTCKTLIYTVNDAGVTALNFGACQP